MCCLLSWLSFRSVKHCTFTLISICCGKDYCTDCLFLFYSRRWIKIIGHLILLFTQILREGYAAHLTKLSSSPASRLAVGNSRLIIRKACFGLPRRPVKGKNKLRRTTSDKPGEESNAVNSSTTKGGFSYTTFRHIKGRRSPFAQDS